ncbi:hypothetical protein ABZ070_25650 [Streptomyces sp. NPDC006283]|uniref:hypothetical protein n=1 Tax=Streptomyces sp. NPDC006283 TaxID=3156741 RepID=UPI0033A8E95A
MLIDLEKTEHLSSGLCLAHARTPIGPVVARWCGDPDALPGPYDAEWTVDEDVIWLGNTHPAPDRTYLLSPQPGGVLLRGRLDEIARAAAVLDLAGTRILLDLADPLPEGILGTWVDVLAEREKVALYPYEL